MKFYKECSLDSFEAWSGGKDTLDYLRERNDCDAVESLIEDVFFDEIPSETEVNDFLWFERDMIAEHLGYSDWDEYEYGTEEEEEDEEEYEEKDENQQ